jgi:hypothetical protein
VSLTYERPSTCTLNGRSSEPATAPTSGSGAPVAPADTGGAIPPVGCYTSAELVTRTGVPHAVLATLAAPTLSRYEHEQCDECDQRDQPEHFPERRHEQGTQPTQYTAIDVVRLAVLDRLMRSGVPVARAAALVQAAETLANTSI